MDGCASEPKNGCRFRPPPPKAAFDTVMDRATKVLGLLGLIGALLAGLSLYFPGTKRRVERLIVPSAHYQIGALGNPPQYDNLVQDTFDHANWSGGDGLHRLADMLEITGSVLRSDTDLAIGRAASARSAELRFAIPRNSCIYVEAVHLAPYRRVTAGLGVERREHRPVYLKLDRSRPYLRSSAARMVEISGGSFRAEKRYLASLPFEYTSVEADRTCSAEVSSGLPLCPRIAVWVKGKRVTC